MTDDEARAFLHRKAAEISEHFDAVQIVASRLEASGTTSCTQAGLGNWYARTGMCKEFIERDQAATAADAVRRAQPPDDGDEWKAENPS